MTEHDNVQFLYVPFQVRQLSDEPRTESNPSSSGDCGNMVHPTMANLCRVTARRDPFCSRLLLALLRLRDLTTSLEKRVMTALVTGVVVVQSRLLIGRKTKLMVGV